MSKQYIADKFTITGGTAAQLLLGNGSFVSGGTSSYVLTSNGTGSAPTWQVAPGAGGGVSGTLTTGYIPKATGSGSIGNSSIYTNGSNILIGTTTDNGSLLNVSGTGYFDSNLTVNGGVINLGADTIFSEEFISGPGNRLNIRNLGNYIGLGDVSNNTAGWVLVNDTNVVINNPLYLESAGGAGSINVDYIATNYNSVLTLDVDTTVNGIITTTGFVKSGGTSSQFLKANGSVDSTVYAPLASPTLTGTPTAPTATTGTNTTQLSTTAFVENSLNTRIVGTPTYFARFDGGNSLEDSNMSQSGTTVTMQGDFVVTNALGTGTITGQSIIKNGGTSSQFLKADGSVDSNTYAVDSTVLHLSGTETISGTKTFTSGITFFKNDTNIIYFNNTSDTQLANITVNSSFFSFANNAGGTYLFKNSASNNILTLNNSGEAIFIGQRFAPQVTPTAKSASATLTIAELLTNIITTSGTSAITLTLPTGTNTDAGILGGSLAVNGSFDWSVINTGTGSGAVTMAAGTGHTYVGGTGVAIGTTAMFRTRKTATNTYVTYKIG